MTKEKHLNDKSKESPCLERTDDKQDTKYLNTNGQEFKSNEIVIFSEHSQETESKSVPVRLLSVSRNPSNTDKDNKGRNDINSNDTDSKTHPNKNVRCPAKHAQKTCARHNLFF